MRRLRIALPVLVALLTALGCGGDDDGNDGGGEDGNGAPEVRTTEAGTVIVGAADEEAGLEVEIQDDTMLVRLAKGAPAAARELAGKPLGGACEVDGEGGVEVARQFPIYWREDPGDWGSAVIRDPIGGGGEYLAEHVTECRIFATEPTGVPEQSSFNEATDEPFTTVKLR
ncbi:MAG: hypothetical protein M3356_06295 [Actinomycetota bacterium]|nr:hypothetical protein [Actinomycetota bacterium]